MIQAIRGISPHSTYNSQGRVNPVALRASNPIEPHFGLNSISLRQMGQPAQGFQPLFRPLPPNMGTRLNFYA